MPAAYPPPVAIIRPIAHSHFVVWPQYWQTHWQSSRNTWQRSQIPSRFSSRQRGRLARSFTSRHPSEGP